MSLPTEQLLVDRLKNGDNASFELLYRLYFPVISTHIVRHSGSSQDAEDIFQEVILVLLQRVQQTDFVLTASLKTYLFAIARNLWLNRLRQARRMDLTPLTEMITAPGLIAHEGEDEPGCEEDVRSWLARITRHCQQILRAIFFYGEPMESLMEKMGWKNKHTAANQQYKCIQQVKKQKDKK